MSILTRFRAADLRTRLVALTGVLVVVAVVGAALVVTLGGESEEEPPPPATPLTLSTPTALDQVFDFQGQPASLSDADLDAISSLVKAYLTAATITPLEHDPAAASESGAQPEPLPDLGAFFSDAARPRLDGEDRLALADDHLPYAEFGVSTERAILDLAALVDDSGSAALVAATIDVEMVARYSDKVLDDDVVIHRRGDLVLERTGDGGWQIGGYQITVERAFGAETTTTEAAFG